MKVRYITEGVFKTKGQVLAAREKERELTNADRLAGTFNKIVIEKMNYIFRDIVQEKKIYPFRSSMFSYKINGSLHDIMCEVKFSKNDVYCTLEQKENGNNIIHLSFDYGIFVTATPSAEVCDKLYVTGVWDEDDIFEDKVLFQKSVATKIKNYINKEYVKPGMKDKEFFDMILDSRIVIDKIYMYSNQNEIEKMVFNISDDLYTMSIKNFVTKNKRNVTENGKYKEELVLEKMMELVDFGVPVEIEMKVETHAPNSKLALISDLFPDYETVNDLENGAGVETPFLKCVDYFLDKNNYEMNRNCYKILKKQIENCSYVVFNYTDTYYGTYNPVKGFVYKQVGNPEITSIAFADTNDKFKSCNIFMQLGIRELDSSFMIYIISNDRVYMTKKGPRSYNDYSRLNEVPVSAAINNNAGCYAEVKTFMNFIERMFGPAN